MALSIRTPIILVALGIKVRSQSNLVVMEYARKVAADKLKLVVPEFASFSESTLV